MVSTECNNYNASAGHIFFRRWLLLYLAFEVIFPNVANGASQEINSARISVTKAGMPKRCCGFRRALVVLVSRLPNFTLTVTVPSPVGQNEYHCNPFAGEHSPMDFRMSKAGTCLGYNLGPLSLFISK